MRIASLPLLRNAQNRSTINILGFLNHLSSIYETGIVDFLEGVAERSDLPVERLGCAVEIPVKDRDDVTGAEEKWIRVKNDI